MKPGARNLITDVEGLLVGNASDEALKSGVTVLTSEQPFVAAVDVRGGAPGTRETDLLAPGKLVERVDALVLSGGSAFGLDAASGVSDVLRERRRGFKAGPAIVPIVPSAILFDLANGGCKDWVETPYRDLGNDGLHLCRARFFVGQHRGGHWRDGGRAHGRARLGIDRYPLGLYCWCPRGGECLRKRRCPKHTAFLGGCLRDCR